MLHGAGDVLGSLCAPFDARARHAARGVRERNGAAVVRAVYCDACVKARGGPARIGEEKTSALLHGRCSDCRAAYCLFCRTPAEAARHKGCSMVNAEHVVAALRIFHVTDIPSDAPTVRDVEPGK